jgi:hypothetical protein
MIRQKPLSFLLEKGKLLQSHVETVFAIPNSPKFNGLSFITGAVSSIAWTAHTVRNEEPTSTNFQKQKNIIGAATTGGVIGVLLPSILLYSLVTSPITVPFYFYLTQRKEEK